MSNRLIINFWPNNTISQLARAPSPQHRPHSPHLSSFHLTRRQGKALPAGREQVKKKRKTKKDYIYIHVNTKTK